MWLQPKIYITKKHKLIHSSLKKHVFYTAVPHIPNFEEITIPMAVGILSKLQVFQEALVLLDLIKKKNWGEKANCANCVCF